MIVKSITLRAGRSPGGVAQTVQVGAVTVFVGPNNSGKSKVLAELGHYVLNPSGKSAFLVLQDVEFNGLDDLASAEAEFESITTPNNPVELPPGHSIVSGPRGVLQVHRKNMITAMQQPSFDVDLYLVWLCSHVLSLGGANRIVLTNQQESGDFQKPPRTSFQRLFKDDQKRSDFRTVVQKALGFYPVIDPTHPGNLRLKTADRAPLSNMEERGWHAEAIAFHSRAEPIEKASDGVKAFTGIVLELIAGNPRVLLIDEPEAFLHPALAFKLGNEIGNLALKEKKNVFVATHSSSYLMGCLQSGSDTNIVRLTYTNKIATSRVLPSKDIVELMRNPLLRSSGVISALFYEFVIVTESDTDRAFYNEINERLIRFNPEWGIPNCLFLNSQGKHTLATIIKPLRELGIPAACIVDIDILKDGGAVWTKFLDAANVPKAAHNPWGVIRNSLHEAFKSTGKDMKKGGGLSLLPVSEQQAANDLFDNLASYGVFAIAGGELESWLKPLDAHGHGPNWLTDIFEKMGDDPNSTSYARPSLDDVWRFIYSIKTWLSNTSRKGIPT